ncbi:hypothetical protein NMY22_g14610 [Coprinellus aureogranulatus]|nr:hypothetical protein NMY22_g14610 [Coprinellus aureogranulatus]
MAGTTSNFNAGVNTGVISQVNHNTNTHVEIQVTAADLALKGAPHAAMPQHAVVETEPFDRVVYTHRTGRYA